MIDHTRTCEQCRHPGCHADDATGLCVFCEDGKPCPVKAEAERRAKDPAAIAADAMRELMKGGVPERKARSLVGKVMDAGERDLAAVVKQAKQLAAPATESEDPAMATKRCKCGTRIKRGKDGTLPDKCRRCRVKDGDVDPNAARKAKAGAALPPRRGPVPNFLRGHKPRKKPGPKPGEQCAGCRIAHTTPAAPANGNGHGHGDLLLHVTEEMLDRFLRDLPVSEKLVLVQRRLEYGEALPCDRPLAGHAGDV